MERLLDVARAHADKVEVFSKESLSDEVKFENSRLKDIDSSRRSGIDLTLIKDGKLGHAYTRNLVDREELVSNALAAMSGGVEAGYELATPSQPAPLHTYDASIEALDTARITDECERICDFFAGKTEGELDVVAAREVTSYRLLTSSGTDVASRESGYFSYAGLRFPGGYSAIRRVTVGKSFVPAEDAGLARILSTYEAARDEVTVEPGKKRVLFLPEVVYGLMWRLQAGTSGKNVYEKTSPLTERLGERIVSRRLTVEDLPLNDSWPGARAYDDEGTMCRDTRLIEEGVLSGFYYDRHYGWRAKAEPTGHGYRPSVGSRVGPTLKHLSIRPGDSSLDEMFKLLGTGIVVAGAMGAHSGNILNGEYSIGLSPGLYVEGGEIVGRVKDAMVAGNAYETLNEVVAVGDTLYPGFAGWFPAILCDNVSFAMRS